ncbi:MAG: PQQ-binding-like beta-propeller repeat protein [Acidimicrobiales bacterium]|nr:PQQ-binding-like beta-propeller repeat protein [Acidimicrobiales bacterium]
MRRTTRVLATATAVIALGGCWAVPGQNADRTAYNPFESGLTTATVGELTQAWATGTGAGPASDPVVSTAGVHVVVDGCTIRTHRPADGSTSWSQSRSIPFVGCDPIVQSSPPFVVGDRVIWGRRAEIRSTYPRCGPNEGMTTFDGDSFQHDIDTGATPTEPTPPAQIVAAVRDDTAVATSPKVFYNSSYDPQCPSAWFANGIVTVGPSNDPAARRSFETSGGTLPTLGVDAVFQTGDGTLATTPGDAAVGQAVRSYSVTTARPGCGGDGNVECPVWVAPTDGAATRVVIAPDQSTLYTGTAAGTVYALDATTGAVQWTVSVGAPVTASPALADGILYVPTGDGRLVAVDAAGTTLWEAATGSAVGVQPAVAGGVVYTGSDDGSVDAFDATGCGAPTCTAVWSAETGSRITGAPAVSNGQLYVGTDDGRLVAYARG